MKVLCFLPDTLAFQNKLGMVTRSAGVDFQPCQNETEVFMFADKEKDKQFFLFADFKRLGILSKFSQQYKDSKIIIVLFDSIQNQTEVYSLMRDSKLNSSDYLDTFFETGLEHTQ